MFAVVVVGKLGLWGWVGVGVGVVCIGFGGLVLIDSDEILLG